MSNISMLEIAELEKTELAPFIRKTLESKAPDPAFHAIMGHNPELAKGIKNNKQFYERMNDIFKWLETEKEKGKIKSYGVASWNGFPFRSNPIGSPFAVNPQGNDNPQSPRRFPTLVLAMYCPA